MTYGKPLFERRKDLDEKKNEIIELYNLGLTVQGLGLLFKEWPGTIYRRLLEWRVVRPSWQTKRLKQANKEVLRKKLRELGYGERLIRKVLK